MEEKSYLDMYKIHAVNQTDKWIGEIISDFTSEAEAGS